MLPKYLYLLAFSFLIAPPLQGKQEDILLAVRSFKTEGFAFYDSSGKLLLSTPPDHSPCTTEEIQPFNPGNYYQVPFGDQVVTMQKPDGFYLIDKDRKILKSFDNTYRWVTPVNDGFFRAYKRISPEQNSSLIEYYDAKGRQCFGTDLYWEGSQVIDRKALVQIWNSDALGYEQDGVWLLLDENGKVLKNITTESGKKITRVTEVHPTYWKMYIASESSYLYVKPSGEFSQKPFPAQPTIDTSHKAMRRIVDSLAVSRGPDFKRILTVSPSWYADDKAYFLMADNPDMPGSRKKSLKDHLFNTVTLQHDGKTVMPAAFVKENFLLTGIVENEKLISLPIFDLNTLQVTGILDEIPDEIVGQHFIYLQESSPFSKTVEYIKDVYGKTIYSIDPSSRVFTTVTEALQYASVAKILSLNNPSTEDFQHIRQLRHLETIELRHYSFPQLTYDFFSHHPALKNLTIAYAPKLQMIPIPDKRTKHLEFVTIIDCPALQQLENFLTNCPSLKEFKTDIFITPELRAKFPNVTFHEVPVEVKME